MILVPVFLAQKNVVLIIPARSWSALGGNLLQIFYQFLGISSKTLPNWPEKTGVNADSHKNEKIRLPSARFASSGDYELWISLKISNVFSAHFFQLKFFDCFSPLSRNLLYNLSLLNIFRMALHNSSERFGLIIKADFPAISGIEELFEAITGVPQAMASRTGIPKPSKKDG